MRVVLVGALLGGIAVGGLTRLTDSGLSITEWRPVTGALPPMTEAEWQSEFDKYKQIDEFQVQNSWMELSDFKNDNDFLVSITFLIRMNFLSGRDSKIPPSPQARAVHAAGPNPPKFSRLHYRKSRRQRGHGRLST